MLGLSVLQNVRGLSDVVAIFLVEGITVLGMYFVCVYYACVLQQWRSYRTCFFALQPLTCPRVLLQILNETLDASNVMSLSFIFTKDKTKIQTNKQTNKQTNVEIVFFID